MEAFPYPRRVTSPRLRDWQLELLQKLVAAEEVLAARGERDEFICFFEQQATAIHHGGLTDPLIIPEGDVRALETAGDPQLNNHGESLWQFDLAPSVPELIEAERALRGTPRPADELAALTAETTRLASERKHSQRALAEWFAEPVRWLAFLALALLAGAIAGASFVATDEPAALLIALAVVGALWGLLERLLGGIGHGRGGASLGRRSDRGLVDAPT